MSDLKEKVEQAVAAFNALTREQQKTHRQAQRESWVRGMTATCEHGMADFEQCPDCRGDTQ